MRDDCQHHLTVCGNQQSGGHGTKGKGASQAFLWLKSYETPAV